MQTIIKTTKLLAGVLAITATASAQNYVFSDEFAYPGDRNDYDTNTYEPSTTHETGYYENGVSDNHGFYDDVVDPARGWSTGVSFQFQSGSQYTSTNINKASYDMSNGESLRYNMGWGLNREGRNKKDPTTIDFSGTNELFQFGLVNATLDDSNTSQYFRNTDSVYLVGEETNWTEAGSHTLDISSIDSSGLPGVVDGTVQTAIASVDLLLRDEAGNTLHNFGNYDFHFTPAVPIEILPFYDFDITFDFNTDGTFNADLTIDEWIVRSRDNTEQRQGLQTANYITASASNVAHNLDDVSALHSAFGINIEDNVYVGNTGAMFDSVRTLTIPEPSSSMLVAIASLGLLIRRRR